MLLRSLYDDKLAQASYIIGCQATGESIVIDPNRDAEQYIRAARKEGLRITHVTETHIHADFLSGTRELAKVAKAKMYLSAEGGKDWQYGFADENTVLLHDGDVFNVGNIRFQVLHTPGHTPEHISFLITDTKSADKPMGLVSGDFVFVGDVGRPDLLEKAAGVSGTMRDGARDLYKSITRFRELPDYLQVWPGHGAGSACGKALGAVPQSTVGYEKMFSAPLSFGSENEFADYILSGQPEPPRYFAVMKRLNRDGPPILGGLPKPRVLEQHEGELLVDTRPAITFAKGHKAGSINIPYNKAFTNWAGAIIPYDVEFSIIADPASAEHIARDLALIGLDNLKGVIAPTALEMTEITELVRTNALENVGDAVVVDVRKRSEWDEGHIEDTTNIPLASLVNRMDELPRDKKLIVHCQSGSRSAIAGSVLQANGFKVANVMGGYEEWEASGRPTVSEASMYSER